MNEPSRSRTIRLSETELEAIATRAANAATEKLEARRTSGTGTINTAAG